MPPVVRVEAPTAAEYKTAPSSGRASFNPNGMLDPSGHRTRKRETTFVEHGSPAAEIQKHACPAGALTSSP